MTDRRTIFLSYSHRDREYAERILTHLRPLERELDVAVWSDAAIRPDVSWKDEMERALRAADLAILLVSADYLASDWIADQELPTLLERASEDGLRVLPVIIHPSAWTRTKLAYFQVWPSDGRPISELPRTERDRVWADLVDQIRVAFSSTDELRTPSEVGAPPVESGADPAGTGVPSDASGSLGDGLRGLFFVSHAKEDGDFAEILKFRLEREQFSAWIDIDVLEAGVNWRQEIDDALLSSAGVILVLSPHARASEYVTYEWAFALGSGVQIVPVMLAQTPVHPRLEVFQYLDFTNRRARPWKRLLSRLGKLALQSESA